jgi:hypothetical protein
MDTITTTLEREWLAKIVDGSKRVEYREIKPYWTLRLSRVSTPFRLVLRNGMNPPVPVLTVRIDRIVPLLHRATRERAPRCGRYLKIGGWG